MMPQSNALSLSPVFIGGLDNSGKTHLRLALSCHPHLAMTRRSYMWTRVYGRFGDLAQAENFELCLHALLSRKDVRALLPDSPRIRREFSRGAPTYGRLFAILHEHYAERMGKPRWGEQEAGIERFADEIFAAYPAAKIIHLLRDPRNRYEEMLRSTPPRFRLGRVGVNTADWQTSAQWAERNRERHREGYMVLAYERLVSQPEQALREVCAFIGEEYVEAMLTLDGAVPFGVGAEAGRSSELETGIVEFRLDRSWAVSPREVAFMQAFARREMTARGYASQPQRLSFAQRLLHYGVDWPLNLMRVALWRMQGVGE